MGIYTHGPWPEGTPVFDPHVEHPHAAEPITVDEQITDHANSCPEGMTPDDVDSALDAAFDPSTAEYRPCTDDDLAEILVEWDGEAMI